MNPMHSTRLLRGCLMWQVPAPINTTSEVVNIMKMEDVPMFWYDFPILHPFFHRSIGKCPYQVTKKHSAVAFWGLAGDSGAILAGPEVSIPGGHRSTERQWPHHDERRVPRPSDPRAPLDGGCFRCCNVQWAIQVEVDSWISINSWYSWSASPLVVGFVFYGASIYPNTSNMCEWPITKWMQRLYFSRMESLFSGFPIWLRQSLRFKYVCCLIWITQNLGKQLAIRFGDLQQLWHRLRFSARMLDRKLLIQQIFGNWIGSNSALGWRYPFFLICLMVFFYSLSSSHISSLFSDPLRIAKNQLFSIVVD